LLFSAILKKIIISSFSDYFCLFYQFFVTFLYFSPAKSFFIELKIKIIRRPRHCCKVHIDIPTLKIELSVKYQNDQKQKDHFIFQKNPLENP
jgi:hypothetical protein